MAAYRATHNYIIVYFPKGARDALKGAGVTVNWLMNKLTADWARAHNVSDYPYDRISPEVRALTSELYSIPDKRVNVDALWEYVDAD